MALGKRVKNRLTHDFQKKMAGFSIEVQKAAEVVRVVTGYGSSEHKPPDLV